MARPVVPVSEKRSVKFTLQLTPLEKEQLTQLAEACGKAPAVLAREKLFKGRFPEPRAAKLTIYTYQELKKIGVNLNQLARKANAGVVPTGLLSLLMKLMQQQETIIAALLYDRESKDR